LERHEGESFWVHVPFNTNVTVKTFIILQKYIIFKKKMLFFLFIKVTVSTKILSFTSDSHFYNSKKCFLSTKSLNMLE